MLVADRACDGDFLVTWFEGLGCDRHQLETVCFDTMTHETHDATVLGISWRQTGKLVLLSKTKDSTIRISKYCVGCFSMNINHLIFVHHIVLSIIQYLIPTFGRHLLNFGSRLKSRKRLDGQSEIVFVDYCSEPRWTEGKYSQSILFWNAKGAVRHRLLLVYNIFVHL